MGFRQFGFDFGGQRADGLTPSYSQNGLNFLINRNVRLRESINHVGGARNLAEVKVAADVVILIERAENALDIALLHAKFRERRKKRKAACDGQILLDNFAQSHGLWRAASTARTRFMAGCKYSPRHAFRSRRTHRNLHTAR
jgi:hypothetical protein